jgi:glycosyltransferase involved in cell wall biosynthesis
MSLIEILIPTYNRSSDLKKNLELLNEQIVKDHLETKVSIIISDNCSPDDTQQVVEGKINSKTYKIKVSYYRNNENIGLEPNVVQVLSKAKAPYILWLGDDDYLAEGYLAYCLEKIERNPALGCIISGLLSINQKGEATGGREVPFTEKEMPAGYATAYEYSHLGHQLSGLVMKREDLLEKYLSQSDYRNPYLFIFFVTDRLLHFPMIYAPAYQTKVSVFNEKDWGYNEVGLLDEVYKSYYYFIDELCEEKVRDLLLRFTVVHSYRFAMNKFRPKRLYKQYKYLDAKVPLKGYAKGLRNMLLKDYVLQWTK